MPKVKIVVTFSQNNSYYDDYDSYSLEIIRSGLTDWEEISDEDYEFILKSKSFYLKKAMNIPDDHEVMILKQDETPLPVRISSVKKIMQKIEDDRIKEEQQRVAKKEATALSRRLKKEAKTREEELALLAELKRKHEDSSINS